MLRRNVLVLHSGSKLLRLRKQTAKRSGRVRFPRARTRYAGQAPEFFRHGAAEPLRIALRLFQHTKRRAAAYRKRSRKVQSRKLGIAVFRRKRLCFFDRFYRIFRIFFRVHCLCYLPHYFRFYYNAERINLNGARRSFFIFTHMSALKNAPQDCLRRVFQCILYSHG